MGRQKWDGRQKREKAGRKGDRPHTHFEKSAPIVQVETAERVDSGSSALPLLGHCNGQWRTGNESVPKITVNETINLFC